MSGGSEREKMILRMTTIITVTVNAITAVTAVTAAAATHFITPNLPALSSL